MMLRLVQLKHPQLGRRVAVVEENKLLLVAEFHSVHALAGAALQKQASLESFTRQHLSSDVLDYDPIHGNRSEWKLLPAFDHPEEPARCLVTGTGLTHRKSAENRQAMHAGTQNITDSMRMYQWGLEGGQPPPGKIGAQPEWFYKGCGTILRAHGEALEVPDFAGDGGDEAELAGAYLIDSSACPHRVGFVIANEFSDHVTEEKNYLYLAHSKLRTCSIGPELIVNADVENLTGAIRIFRGAQIAWHREFKTGEKNMNHTLANLEHHHFKYPAHRRPGDAHIHFLGADAFSFGDGFRIQDGDVIEIELAGFGRPLRNPVTIDRRASRFIAVPQL
jgi:hypothetical protein